VAYGGGSATPRVKQEAKKFEDFALGVAEPPPGQMGWLYNFFLKKSIKIKKEKKVRVWPRVAF
jgi:hypothetical protein